MRSPRERGSLRPLLGLLAAAVVASCGAPQFRIEQPIDRVVLITVDTLRYDHLGSSGYPLHPTPFLDELAAEGFSFTRAFAQASATGPTHASLFTSLYPLQHGVSSNGKRLDDSFVTLAEVLRDEGFRTAAFVSTNAHFIDRRGNLCQGFEVCNEQPPPSAEDMEDQEWRREYRPATETVEAALGWLRDVSPDDRFLLWVHLYDPHKPLRPPEPYRELIGGRLADFGEPEFRGFLREEQGIDVGDDVELLESILDYDAETLYVDDELRRLSTSMASMGLGDRAVWVVSADHGQGLGHHGWFGHSKLIYNSQLQVPLIFHFSETDFGERHVDDHVAEHVDVAPTLLELVGRDLSSQVLPVTGRSLVPRVVGNNEGTRKWFSFAERVRYIERRQHLPNYEAGERYALQDREYKYILFTEGIDEFYDLVEDPSELVNLIDDPAYAERRDQLRDVLVGMIAELASGIQAESVEDSETIERLRALGYIQ